ncbi:peptidoglycan-binding protein [Candidatus Absconditicoccus praedator]|uniref:peptidoglycan-binding protein n=1 Tax=Candidatus Absconditicoccus praedator TaxID=2735562 RepID=UPI001E484FDA|nr:peptidoglycan-binding protein [Candidatus Absconditicoccus praedator]UFX83009.1 peptidoglycan-binding protein [Candidatus Absconditicoccus praedator]
MKIQKTTKIILILSFFLFSSFSFANNVDTSNCEKRYFIVSGYYSPLEGQDFYYRSDFYREIRLNGRGTHGASGRAVFNGMIAAPRNYEFGTNIYFPGYGMGEVHDRGQAIVNAGQRGYSHDRIDIWMGYGEEGLKRALSFGKRTIAGYVCPGGESGFDMDQFPIHNDFFRVSLWGVYLTPGRQDPFVETLQEYMYKLGYIDDSSVTGYYGPITRQAVCKFQQVHGITDSSDNYCGYFGPRTRSVLKDLAESKGFFNNDMYKNYIITTTKEEDDTPLAGIESQEEPDESTDSSDMDENDDESASGVSFERGIPKGEESEEVAKIESYLVKFGYLDESNKNSKYDMNTIVSIYRFQLDNGILSEDADISIKGYFGPSTRDKFNQKIEKL